MKLTPKKKNSYTPELWHGYLLSTPTGSRRQSFPRLSFSSGYFLCMSASRRSTSAASPIYVPETTAPSSWGLVICVGLLKAMC
jgi:hypothetical protein